MLRPRDPRDPISSHLTACSKAIILSERQRREVQILCFIRMPFVRARIIYENPLLDRSLQCHIPTPSSVISANLVPISCSTVGPITAVLASSERHFYIMILARTLVSRSAGCMCINVMRIFPTLSRNQHLAHYYSRRFTQKQHNTSYYHAHFRSTIEKKTFSFTPSFKNANTLRLRNVTERAHKSNQYHRLVLRECGTETRRSLGLGMVGHVSGQTWIAVDVLGPKRNMDRH